MRRNRTGSGTSGAQKRSRKCCLQEIFACKASRYTPFQEGEGEKVTFLTIPDDPSVQAEYKERLNWPQTLDLPPGAQLCHTHFPIEELKKTKSKTGHYRRLSDATRPKQHDRNYELDHFGHPVPISESVSTPQVPPTPTVTAPTSTIAEELARESYSSTIPLRSHDQESSLSARHLRHLEEVKQKLYFLIDAVTNWSTN